MNIKTIGTVALVAAMVTGTAAHASSVTVSTDLPTAVGLLDGDVGQSGTYFNRLETSIGSFWGDGVIYAANTYNVGVALAPAFNDHAYMGIDGNEDLVLTTPTTSFSFLWGSVDGYNTAETIQGMNSVMVMGNAVEELLPSTAPGRTGWVTITSDVAFSQLEFHSIGPAMEIQFDPPAAVPELSTWAMMLVGLVGLGYAAMRKGRAALA